MEDLALLGAHCLSSPRVLPSCRSSIFQNTPPPFFILPSRPTHLHSAFPRSPPSPPTTSASSPLRSALPLLRLNAHRAARTVAQEEAVVGASFPFSLAEAAAAEEAKPAEPEPEEKTVVVAKEKGTKTVEAIEETVVPAASEPAAAAEAEAPAPVAEPKEDLIWGMPLVGDDEHTETVLLKFLRAREFKVKEAMAMLKAAVLWRKRFGIDALLGTDLDLPEMENVVFYREVPPPPPPPRLLQRLRRVPGQGALREGLRRWGEAGALPQVAHPAPRARHPLAARLRAQRHLLHGADHRPQELAAHARQAPGRLVLTKLLLESRVLASRAWQ